MMKTRKLLAIALILATFFALPAYSEGDEIIITPFSDSFFNSYSISLGKSSSTIHISFRTTAKQTSAILGAPTYDVQRKVNGSWTTVANDLTGNQGTDTASFSFSKNYRAVSGYSYRVIAKFYCKKYDGTSKAVSCTSSSISV